MSVLDTFKTYFFGDITPETPTPSNKAVIAEGVGFDNSFKLFSPAGEFLGSYTRRRDAVRGAHRRGFEV